MKMHTKVFISMPMKDLSAEEIHANWKRCYGFLQRHYNGFCLACKGIEVMNSYDPDLDVSAAKNKELAFLGHSITKLSQADVLVMAKGWRFSRGCRMERELAVAYDIGKILYEEDDDAEET
jgi:hypothetical protein